MRQHNTALSEGHRHCRGLGTGLPTPEQRGYRLPTTVPQSHPPPDSVLRTTTNPPPFRAKSRGIDRSAASIHEAVIHHTTKVRLTLKTDKINLPELPPRSPSRFRQSCTPRPFRGGCGAFRGRRGSAGSPLATFAAGAGASARKRAGGTESRKARNMRANKRHL